jgi:DNA-directed RNA polymerase I subunit RPA43
MTRPLFNVEVPEWPRKMATIASSTPNGHSSEKKRRKDKSHKSHKKRAREDDDPAELDERTHKKPKSSASKSNADLPQSLKSSPTSQTDVKATKISGKKSFLSAEYVVDSDSSPAPPDPEQSVARVAKNVDVPKKTKDKMPKNRTETERAAQKLETMATDTENKAKKTKEKNKSTIADVRSVERPSVAQSKEAVKPKKKHDKEHKSKKDKYGRKESHRDGNDATHAAANGIEKEKKSKKHRSRDQEGQADAIQTATEEQLKEGKKKEREKKKSRNNSPPSRTNVEPETMDIDSFPNQTWPAPSGTYQPAHTPRHVTFPLYTQDVCLYVPLYPIGWDQPVTAAAKQHLTPLLNRYVPLFKGVLLAFRNVALCDEPTRRSASTDDTQTVILTSVDEAAVGFVYVCAELDLFQPERGAWMEGAINLQNEGHIGVVCWKRFNASIEASRLPPGYRYIQSESPEAASYPDEADDTISYLGTNDLGLVHQIHATGFWVDAAGTKLKGRLRFRILNYDVGVTEGNAYLSLEGTMLDDEGEKALAAKAAEETQRLKDTKGITRHAMRQVPEFSLTSFGDEEVEETPDNRKVTQSSRVGSEELTSA